MPITAQPIGKNLHDLRNGNSYEDSGMGRGSQVPQVHTQLPVLESHESLQFQKSQHTSPGLLHVAPTPPVQVASSGMVAPVSLIAAAGTGTPAMGTGVSLHKNVTGPKITPTTPTSTSPSSTVAQMLRLPGFSLRLIFSLPRSIEPSPLTLKLLQASAQSREFCFQPSQFSQ